MSAQLAADDLQVQSGSKSTHGGRNVIKIGGQKLQRKKTESPKNLLEPGDGEIALAAAGNIHRLCNYIWFTLNHIESY